MSASGNRFFYSLFTAILIFYSCADPDKKDSATTVENTLQADTGKYVMVRDTISAISVSAINLTQAFLDNEVSAENKYKGRKLSVEGTIEDIKRGYASGSVFISLKGCERFTSVQCFLKDEQAVEKLKRGQTARLVGICAGLNVNVILDKSELVTNK